MTDSLRNSFAKDAYRQWKGRVKEASNSLVVFTPYFDQNLVHLLKNAEIEQGKIKVITDLYPVTSLTYPKQLIAAKKLIEMGIDVRQLSRLHAKILWTDGSYFILGSQNFTSFSRKSKEVSVFPSEDLSQAKIVVQLEEWVNESESVDTNLLNSLISRLESSDKILKGILKEREEIWHEELTKLEGRKIDLRPVLTKLVEESEYEFGYSYRNGPRNAIWLEKSYIDESWDVEWDMYTGGRYFTLLNRDADLCRLVHKRYGHRKPVKFKYWPLIFPESGRIVFARITKTRITFFKFAVDRIDWPMKREGFPNLYINSAYIDLDTPLEGNLTITFKGKYVDDDTGEWFDFRYESNFRFDGESLAFLNGREEKETYQPHLIEEAMMKYCMEDPEYIFIRAFSGFKYNNSQLGKKNSVEILNKELGSSIAYISVISYAEQPIFVMESWRAIYERQGIEI